MPQFQVDPERIASSSAAVSASVDAIRHAVQGMYANLNALQDAWRGPAATQFQEISTQWRSAQERMETSLQAIQMALSKASSLYTDTEAQASRLFSS